MIAGIMACLATAVSPGATDYSNTIRELSPWITNQLRISGASSLALALVDSNEVVWAAGFGLADPLTGRAAAADYDGDGKADPACYCQSNGLWGCMLSASAYAVRMLPFGGPDYPPVR